MDKLFEGFAKIILPFFVIVGLVGVGIGFAVAQMLK